MEHFNPEKSSLVPPPLPPPLPHFPRATPSGPGITPTTVSTPMKRPGRSVLRPNSAIPKTDFPYATSASTASTSLAIKTEMEKRFPSRDTSSTMRGSGEAVSRSNSQCNGMSQEISDEDFKVLLAWLDKIPFTRQRKHLHRDFSDGVLMAELIAHFFPKMIELHNYAAANNTTLKKNNWDLLNRKIFPKLGIKLQDAAIESICVAKPGLIEPVLGQIRKLIEKKTEEEEFARAQELAGNANGDCGDGSGAALPLTEEICLVHLLPQDIPEFVIFRSKKFYPEDLLDSKQKCIEESSVKIKEMSSKVRRLETLVNLKEKHLEDLTRQVHHLRLQLGEVQPHESVCKWEDEEQLPPIFFKKSFN